MNKMLVKVTTTTKRMYAYILGFSLIGFIVGLIFYLVETRPKLVFHPELVRTTEAPFGFGIFSCGCLSNRSHRPLQIIQYNLEIKIGKKWIVLSNSPITDELIKSLPKDISITKDTEDFNSFYQPLVNTKIHKGCFFNYSDQLSIDDLEDQINRSGFYKLKLIGKDIHGNDYIDYLKITPNL